MAEVSPLRRRMIEDMTIRNLSPATQQSYTYAVAKFSRHCSRSPDRLGLEDVRAYQLYLIAQQRSWSHINQVVCALALVHCHTEGEMVRNPERLGDDWLTTDGIGASGRQHSVQDRHGDGSLTLLGSKATGAQIVDAPWQQFSVRNDNRPFIVSKRAA